MGKASNRPQRRRPLSLDRYEAPTFDAQAETERDDVVFFRIKDGDRVDEFAGPRSVPRPTTLQALDIYARQGEAVANVFMLQTVLGLDGYEALLSLKDADDETFDLVLEAVSVVVLGKEANRVN